MDRFVSRIVTGLVFLGISASLSASPTEVGTLNTGNIGVNIDAGHFQDPILIVGVSTRNDNEPGVISVVPDGFGSFQVRFREWNYLDGIHGDEDIPYLVIERGRTAMNDGSVWEAGTFSLGGGSKNILFSEKFEHAPVVLLSPQSENDPETYSLRVEGVTRYSFSTALKEQESPDTSGHNQETIAWLAIYSPANTGITDGSIAYTVSQAIVNDTPSNVLGNSLYIEEETSRDAETYHIDEVISALSTLSGMFAQTTTIYGGNPENLALAVAFIPSLIPGDKTGANGNIALIGTNGLQSSSYSASSTWPSDLPASAFDGYVPGLQVNSDAVSQVNRGTWIASKASSGRWLQVEFDQTVHLTGFSSTTTASSLGATDRSPKDVTIQVSEDGINFTDHESFILPITGSTELFTTPAIGRYIRFFMASNYGGPYYQIEELEYYGSFFQSPENGTPEEASGSSCMDVLNTLPGTVSGYYVIDPDGTGGVEPFETYCDMTFDGGGWTLVAKRRDTVRNEVITITNDNTDQHIGDSAWIAIKTISTELYVEQPAVSRWAIAPFSNIEGTICIPLTDSLSTPRIFHAESSGCDTASLDYTMVGYSNSNSGYSNVWNHMPGIFTSESGFSSPAEGADGTIVDIYVR